MSYETAYFVAVKDWDMEQKPWALNFPSLWPQGTVALPNGIKEHLVVELWGLEKSVCNHGAQFAS